MQKDKGCSLKYLNNNTLLHWCFGIRSDIARATRVQYHPVVQNTSAIMALFLFHTLGL